MEITVILLILIHQHCLIIDERLPELIIDPISNLF